MDPITKKQIEIDRKKEIIIKSYPKVWRKILAEWSTPDSNDRGWMLYSANYLFHTAGIRWAIDPIRLNWRIPDAPQVDISPLAGLDFILFTHRHSDHLDLELLNSLKNFPITWVIPEFLLNLIRSAGLQPQKIIIPNPMEPICLDGITLTPFDGFHWEGSDFLESDRRGVPSRGYMVEFNGKRWLFPGDTRTYHPDALTCFGPVDILVVHLWLGRSCALQEKPALLEAFCQFCLSSQPKRIIITHLEEFGRQPEDYWDARHYDLVLKWFCEHAPKIQVEFALIGYCISA